MQVLSTQCHSSAVHKRDNIELLGECLVPVKYQNQGFDKLPLLIAEGQPQDCEEETGFLKIKLKWPEYFLKFLRMK